MSFKHDAATFARRGKMLSQRRSDCPVTVSLTVPAEKMVRSGSVRVGARYNRQGDAPVQESSVSFRTWRTALWVGAHSADPGHRGASQIGDSVKSLRAETEVGVRPGHVCSAGCEAAADVRPVRLVEIRIREHAVYLARLAVPSKRESVGKAMRDNEHRRRGVRHVDRGEDALAGVEVSSAGSGL